MPRKQPLLLHLGLVASLALAPFAAGCGGSTNSVNANTVLVGNYGGTSVGTNQVPASLQLTGSSGQLNLPCDSNYRFTQPLVIDGNGHFSVAGTSYSSFPVQPDSGAKAVPVVLSGTASGDTITVTVTDDTFQRVQGTYTVVKGKDAPTFTGVCPG